MEEEFDDDIDAGRQAAHGIAVGIGSAAHAAIDANDELTASEKRFQHAMTAALQGLTHAIVEVVADAVQQKRDDP